MRGHLLRVLGSLREGCILRKGKIVVDHTQKGSWNQVRTLMHNDYYSDVLGDALPSVRVQGFASELFVVNGRKVKGSLLCYGGRYYIFQVKQVKDISCESLALVDIVKPKPEVLVIGGGSSHHPISNEIRKFLYERNIGIEVGNTPTAISTYNILQQDGRRVAALLIPVD